MQKMPQHLQLVHLYLIKHYQQLPILPSKCFRQLFIPTWWIYPLHKMRVDEGEDSKKIHPTFNEFAWLCVIFINPFFPNRHNNSYSLRSIFLVKIYLLNLSLMLFSFHNLGSISPIFQDEDIKGLCNKSFTMKSPSQILSQSNLLCA